MTWQVQHFDNSTDINLELTAQKVCLHFEQLAYCLALKQNSWKDKIFYKQEFEV